MRPVLCVLCVRCSVGDSERAEQMYYPRWGRKQERWNRFLIVFFFHSYDLYSFRRTLTRILSGWLQTARISSLVFVVRGWPCQVSVHLILRGKFLLENTNENIELSEHFFSYKSLYDVQKGANTRRI